MSEQYNYRINCPQCNTEQEVVLYEAINVDEQPELRELLMQNQLNVIQCTKCQYHFRIDKPLVYKDPARRAMIYWIPTPDDATDKGEEQFQTYMEGITQLLPDDIDLPQVQLVFSRVELVERIFMLEEGLDERIVEYIKYLIYTKNIERVDSSTKRLLCNTQDSTAEILYFVIQDMATNQLEGMLEYKRAAYTAFFEMFDQDDHVPDLMELFPGPYISARHLILHENRIEAE